MAQEFSSEVKQKLLAALQKTIRDLEAEEGSTDAPEPMNSNVVSMRHAPNNRREQYVDPYANSASEYEPEYALEYETGTERHEAPAQEDPSQFRRLAKQVRSLEFSHDREPEPAPEKPRYVSTPSRAEKSAHNTAKASQKTEIPWADETEPPLDILFPQAKNETLAQSRQQRTPVATAETDEWREPPAQPAKSSKSNQAAYLTPPPKRKDISSASGVTRFVSPFSDATSLSASDSDESLSTVSAKPPLKSLTKPSKPMASHHAPRYQSADDADFMARYGTQDVITAEDLVANEAAYQQSRRVRPGQNTTGAAYESEFTGEEASPEELKAYADFVAQRLTAWEDASETKSDSSRSSRDDSRDSSDFEVARNLISNVSNHFEPEPPRASTYSQEPGAGFHRLTSDTKVFEREEYAQYGFDFDNQFDDGGADSGDRPTGVYPFNTRYESPELNDDSALQQAIERLEIELDEVQGLFETEPDMGAILYPSVNSVGPALGEETPELYQAMANFDYSSIYEDTHSEPDYHESEESIPFVYQSRSEIIDSEVRPETPGAHQASMQRADMNFGKQNLPLPSVSEPEEFDLYDEGKPQARTTDPLHQSASNLDTVGDNLLAEHKNQSNPSKKIDAKSKFDATLSLVRGDRRALTPETLPHDVAPEDVLVQGVKLKDIRSMGGSMADLSGYKDLSKAPLAVGEHKKEGGAAATAAMLASSGLGGFEHHQAPSLSNETFSNDLGPEVDSDFNGNFQTLIRLINELPEGVTKQTGAQIIRLTMESMGIFMEDVLSDAQAAQSEMLDAVRANIKKIEEYKTIIRKLETDIKYYQGKANELSEIIDLFILSNSSTKMPNVDEFPTR